MRKHIFAIFLEFFIVGGGVIVEFLTDITPVLTASVVMVISLIGMILLYYKEIAGWLGSLSNKSASPLISILRDICTVALWIMLALWVVTTFAVVAAQIIRFAIKVSA